MSDLPQDAQVLQIKVTLLEVSPPIWRRLLVPAGLSLARLHECIQVAMGWTFRHLHEFQVGDRRYGEPDPEVHDPQHPVYQDALVKLSTVLERGITRFLYIYDFGDNWQHEIIIEESVPADPQAEYPLFVDGERRCPPKDCGGPPGYQAFLEAVTNPSHPEHKDAVWWYGEAYDPDDIERYIIDIQLTRIARSRRGGLKARGRPRKPR